MTINKIKLLQLQQLIRILNNNMDLILLMLNHINQQHTLMFNQHQNILKTIHM